jgi:hypothetical protein
LRIEQNRCVGIRRKRLCKVQTLGRQCEDASSRWSERRTFTNKNNEDEKSGLRNSSLGAVRNEASKAGRCRSGTRCCGAVEAPVLFRAKEELGILEQTVTHGENGEAIQSKTAREPGGGPGWSPSKAFLALLVLPVVLALLAFRKVVAPVAIRLSVEARA